MHRSRRALTWAGGLFAAVLLLGGAALYLGWLKGPVEHFVSHKTGRAFEIGGMFRITPGIHPRMRMQQVRFANPDWAVERETLRIDEAVVTISVWELLHGRVLLPEVTLTRPFVDLERNADATLNNWTLASDEEQARGQGQPPRIGRLAVDEGVLRFRDPSTETDVALKVQTTADGGDAGVRFAADGKYQGQAVAAAGTGGAMLSLLDATLPYPLDGKFAVGATHGTVAGSITGLAAFAAADLKVDVSGETLSEIYVLSGVAIPPTPPYRIRGRLIREGTNWRFHDFAGRVGDSDLSGDADVAAAPDQRLKLTARLESKLLDLDDLGGFIGARPQAGAGETASPRQKHEKAAAQAAPTLFPDVPIKLDRLRAMDADVTLNGKSIRGKTVVDDLQTHLVLTDGVLKLAPLDFGVAGGNVVSTLTLDGRGDKAGVESNFEFRRIDLRKLFPGNATVAKATGLVGGRVVLKGTGNSLAELMAGADGTLGFAMSGGQVSNLVLELAGLDAAEALRFLFLGDKTVELRCAVADVGVEHGVLRAKSIVVDTTDTNIKIEGSIDLSSEKLDVTVHPLPKDYSLLALRSPIHVRGTFKDMSIRPDKELLLRGGIAGVLGTLVGPFSAIVGLIETGPGDDADCEHLIAAVEHDVQRNVPEAGSP